jgi:peptidoglycan/LPS O-acetylase OafA/YrhL
VALGAVSNSIHLIAPLVASLATAGLIICLSSPVATSISLLRVPPLRYVGKISYGLYLYHWPIFMLGEKWKFHTPFHLYAAALIVLIFAVAALSYEFVEKPFLSLKERLPRGGLGGQTDGAGGQVGALPRPR